MNYPLKFKKGFTLVETMVAISILMLAILGPLSIASSGLRNSLFAKDQVTAYYLAQEGIEYVRYIRDDNYLQSSGNWLDGLEDCTGTYGCAIDTGKWFGSNNSVIRLCQLIGCSDYNILYKDFSTKYYTHQTGGGNTATPFSRIVKVEETTDEKEIKVTSTVTWQSGVGQKSFELTENVFNIYRTL
jgi:prepilin-type N-terminal cleavage/methylation domain-containing protein